MTVANGINGPAHQGANIDAPRFEGVLRPYSEADVAKLQGSLKIEHTLANEGAKKLWVRAKLLCLRCVLSVLCVRALPQADLTTACLRCPPHVLNVGYSHCGYLRASHLAVQALDSVWPE